MSIKLLVLDYETSWTTPVNPRQCRIHEIGAVLYDWHAYKPLKMLSEFVYEDDHVTSPKELIDLTGITDDMRKEWGLSLKEGLRRQALLMEKCDFVVAHNGNEFDKIVYQNECERVGILPVDKPWIDTKVDVEYPPAIKTTKLTYLCAEHGFVNPFSHRAIFDALSTAKLLKMYDIEKVIELSKQTTVQVVASVGYENRQLAKDRGYHFDGERKLWKKHLKEKAAEAEKLQAPFQVQIRNL